MLLVRILNDCKCEKKIATKSVFSLKSLKAEVVLVEKYFSIKISNLECAITKLFQGGLKGGGYITKYK